MKNISIRIKRILFAKKNYEFLKKCWSINYPYINAIFGKVGG